MHFLSNSQNTQKKLSEKRVVSPYTQVSCFLTYYLLLLFTIHINLLKRHLVDDLLGQNLA